MTATQPNLLTLARQGNAGAIATVFNRKLQPKGISVKASSKNSTLHLKLESHKELNQQALVAAIRKGLMSLKSEAIQTAVIYGWQTGDDFPAWQEEVNLPPPSDSSPSDSLNGTSDAANGTESTTLPEQAAASKAGGTLWDTMFNAFSGAANTADSPASNGQATKSITQVATETSTAISQTGQAASQMANQFMTGMAEALGSTASNAANSVGYVLSMIDDSPQLAELTKTLKVDWLINIINSVDVVKAERHVRKLQKKYSKEQPCEISHRIMMEKVIYVGGSGFASDMVPKFVANTFALDATATTKAQAEMGYQIACAYGLDVHEPARKGEIAAIFGLALGGSHALKTGFQYFAKSMPASEAVVGASTNAVALYAVGHAACQFYENQMNGKGPSQSTEAMNAIQDASEDFFEDAIAQQIVMDQILAHVVLASHPQKTWKTIGRELKALNFSAESLKLINQQANAPASLDSLLDQISPEFAVPLLAQCQRIVSSDGVVTAEESAVIETITNRLTNTQPSSQSAQSTPQSTTEAAKEQATKGILKGLLRFRNRGKKD